MVGEWKRIKKELIYYIYLYVLGVMYKVYDKEREYFDNSVGWYGYKIYYSQG